MSAIVKYTMMKKDGETTRMGAGDGDLVVTGVFVTHLFEYQELVQKTFQDRAAAQAPTLYIRECIVLYICILTHIYIDR